MTVMHHPSPETLACHAAGTLSPGLSLVVAAHVAGCAACQTEIATFEAAGGIMLDDLPPTGLSGDAVDVALARIERPRPVAPPAPRRTFKAELPSSITVPRSLRDRDVGGWRWLAPGVRWSRVAVPEDGESTVFLIRVQPGKRLPEHGHTGLEFTHVLSGSFHDSQGRYGPGDTLEVDADIDHQPIADLDAECICLVAVDGRIKLHGLIGRVLRPFTGV